jgi:hypothetical protein
METFSHRGYDVELLPTGPRGVLALVFDGESIVHGDTSSTEAGAVEAARRWIDATVSRDPAGPAVLVPAAAGTFAVGQLLALPPAGWALADNTDGDLPAVGIVRSAGTTGARLVTSRGEIVRWTAHGLGSAGQRRWLGTAGATVSSEPSGSAVRIVQEVIRVVDADHVLLFPDNPWRI